MSEGSEFPNVRLVVAGVASLLLLAWLGFVPNTLPPLLAFPNHAPASIRMIMSAGLSSIILTALLPVIAVGSVGQRLLALLVAPFPALVLAITALSLLSLLFN